MLGGTVIASFDATRIDQRARYDVVVSERRQELARTTVDLASLR
jgi:enolase